jgi:hypothetical protein
MEAANDAHYAVNSVFSHAMSRYRIGIHFVRFHRRHPCHQQEHMAVTANDSYTVCHNVAIPPNYAVMGINTNYGCPNDRAITVAPAQDNLRICNLSETIGGAPFQLPFPADFIVKSIEQVD